MQHYVVESPLVFSLIFLICKVPPIKVSIEVSHTVHSHIIGRGGQQINALMKETSTKIHFPDENRIAGERKSNTGWLTINCFSLTVDITESIINMIVTDISFELGS